MYVTVTPRIIYHHNLRKMYLEGITHNATGLKHKKGAGDKTLAKALADLAATQMQLAGTKDDLEGTGNELADVKKALADCKLANPSFWPRKAHYVDYL